MNTGYRAQFIGTLKICRLNILLLAVCFVAGKAQTITTPSGGEQYLRGRQVNIRWSASPSYTAADVELWRSGSPYKMLATKTNNDGSFPWTIGSTIAESTTSTYQIRLSFYERVWIPPSYGDGKSDYVPGHYEERRSGVTATSGAFKVVPESITVTQPTSSISLRDRQKLEVRWIKTYLKSSWVYIDLYRGSTKTHTISSPAGNNGAIDWTIPATISTATNYKVKVSEAERYTVNVPCDDGSGGKTTCSEQRYRYGDVIDYSAGFSLTKSALDFTTAGSRSIEAGIPFKFSWDDNITKGSLALEYWGGSGWQALATLPHEETSYEWLVPPSLGGSGTRLRIRSTEYAHMEDTIDNLQVVPYSAYMSIAQPAGGDHYRPGQSLPVRWASNQSPVDIDLLGTDGQAYAMATEQQAGTSPASDKLWNTLSPAWTIPQSVPDGQYQVRITGADAVAYSQVFGIGDGVARQVVSYDDYDSWGNLTKATDANGNEVEYVYGTNSDPLSASASGINGAAGVYLTGIRQANGAGPALTTTAGYGPRGLLSALAGANGDTTRFGYDGLGRLAEVRNAAGEVTSAHAYTYAGAGFSPATPNWIRTSAPDGHGPDRVTTQYLDGLGRPIQTEQRVGGEDIVASTAYDSQGREHRSYKPFRHDTGHGYDASFASHGEAAYGGNRYPFVETRYEESPLNRPVKTIPEGGETEQGAVTTGYHVDSWNGHNYLVTTTTDEEGNASETWTDGWGRTVKTVADPGGIAATTAFEYDALDNLIGVKPPNYFDPPDGSSPADWVTSYRYDARGQLIQKISPDAGAVRYRYDRAGNLRFTEDANRAGSGELVYTGYDALGRPVREGVAKEKFDSLKSDIDNPFETQDSNLWGAWAYDEKPATTTYPWNQFAAQINAASLRNPKGQLAAQAWRFGGSSEVAPVTTVDGVGVAESEAYQAADSLSATNTIVDPNGRLTLSSGRLIRLGPGFHAKAGSQVTASIDPALKGGQGASGVAGANPWQLTLFSYDDEGRVVDKWIWTGDKREWDTHLAYDYNRQDEVTRLQIDVAGQTLYQHYTYNQRGLLAGVYISTDGVQPAQPEVAYTYTATGAVDRINYKGNKDMDYGYTIRDWVNTINNVESPAGNFAAKYKYFDNGNVKIAEFHNPQVQAGGGTKKFNWKFTYNKLDRLSSANYDSTSSSTSMFDVTGLAYDDAGNIDYLKRRDETGSLIDDLDYLYDAGTNRLKEIQDATGKQTGWDAFGSTFGYDENGNLTSQTGKLTNVAYDHRNLPVQFTLSDPDTFVVANYNADGQRILKESSGGAWQFYVMDGPQAMAVIKNDGQGQMSTHFNLVGNATFGRWEPGGVRRYYLKDVLGSTRAVVDENGNIKETRDFYPFGLTMPGRSYSAGTETLEKFTGKERDDTTGLDYFGARYYSPAFGRWLSTDPLASKYPSLSPYNYVANNPVNAFDPDGRDIWFVHGTFSTSNTWIRDEVDYAQRWATALDDEIGGRFDWTLNSYMNTKGSRQRAAESLADQIEEAYTKNPEMLVQLVGHSHGGNVAVLAANILRERGINVDRLVLLGTPSRRDYILDDELAERTQVLNAYSDKDLIQLLGGTDFSLLPRLTRLAGRNRSKTEDAHEINVTLVGDGEVKHTNVHTTQDIIDLIKDFLNSEESKQ